VISLEECADLIANAAAVVFDNMALAWVNVDEDVLEHGEKDELWLEYTHEDNEEGLIWTFNFDKREQEIILEGDCISLVDARGEPAEIHLLTKWFPDQPQEQ
jgi:hypothetical protein